MRGEHYAEVLDLIDLGGSSPHARGALLHGSTAPPCAGIIPACAGSTPSILYRAGRREDHPRMRGEHKRALFLVGGLKGSSPHARGALDASTLDRFEYGIIPACAGSTAEAIVHISQYGDHPRMRGEHGQASWHRASCWGSSPHARGAHALKWKLDGQGGIIPACAGSTFTTSASGQHSRLIHSLFASSSHPSGLSSDYIFARRDTCWHCSNPWRVHRQVSRYQCRSVGG